MNPCRPDKFKFCSNCPESLWSGQEVGTLCDAVITGLSRVSRPVPMFVSSPWSHSGIRDRDRQFVCFSGDPRRTKLSTNGSCQLEKTENSAPKWTFASY